GSINGGAKIFVLELIRRLAKIAPQTQLILLATKDAYYELATLEGPNVVRQLVNGNVNPAPKLPKWRNRLFTYAMRRLPAVGRHLAYELRKLFLPDQDYTLPQA